MCLAACTDQAKLGALTTAKNIEEFKATYFKCVVRDTPAAGTMAGVKMDATLT